MVNLSLLVGLVVLLVFGLAAVLVFTTFGVAAVAWTVMAFEVFRDSVWKPFCGWLSQPCCDNPEREFFVVRGGGVAMAGSTCKNCDHVKIYPNYPH